MYHPPQDACERKDSYKNHVACTLRRATLLSPPCRVLRRIQNWKWRETKLQPSRARPGQVLGCNLVSLHFRCGILRSHPVHLQEAGHGKDKLSFGPLKTRRGHRRTAGMAWALGTNSQEDASSLRLRFNQCFVQLE